MRQHAESYHQHDKLFVCQHVQVFRSDRQEREQVSAVSTNTKERKIEPRPLAQLAAMVELNNLFNEPDPVKAASSANKYGSQIVEQAVSSESVESAKPETEAEESSFTRWWMDALAELSGKSTATTVDVEPDTSSRLITQHQSTRRGPRKSKAPKAVKGTRSVVASNATTTPVYQPSVNTYDFCDQYSSWSLLGWLNLCPQGFPFDTLPAPVVVEESPLNVVVDPKKRPSTSVLTVRPTVYVTSTQPVTSTETSTTTTEETRTITKTARTKFTTTTETPTIYVTKTKPIKKVVIETSTIWTDRTTTIYEPKKVWVQDPSNTTTIRFSLTDTVSSTYTPSVIITAEGTTTSTSYTATTTVFDVKTITVSQSDGNSTQSSGRESIARDGYADIQNCISSRDFASEPCQAINPFVIPCMTFTIFLVVLLLLMACCTKALQAALGDDSPPSAGDGGRGASGGDGSNSDSDDDEDGGIESGEQEQDDENGTSEHNQSGLDRHSPDNTPVRNSFRAPWSDLSSPRSQSGAKDDASSSKNSPSYKGTISDVEPAPNTQTARNTGLPHSGFRTILDDKSLTNAQRAKLVDEYVSAQEKSLTGDERRVDNQSSESRSVSGSRVSSSNTKGLRTPYKPQHKYTALSQPDAKFEDDNVSPKASNSTTHKPENEQTGNSTHNASKIDSVNRLLEEMHEDLNDTSTQQTSSPSKSDSSSLESSKARPETREAHQTDLADSKSSDKGSSVNKVSKDPAKSEPGNDSQSTTSKKSTTPIEKNKAAADIVSKDNVAAEPSSVGTTAKTPSKTAEDATSSQVETKARTEAAPSTQTQTKESTKQSQSTATSKIMTAEDRAIIDQSAKARAMQRYHETFPNGHRLYNVSGDGLLCGPRALIESFKRQMGSTPPSSPDGFKRIEVGPDLASERKVFELATGEANTNNYSTGELSAMLQDWGNKCGWHLRLGVWPEQGVPHIMEESAEPGVDITVIWIYNNRGIELHGHKWNHYQAMIHPPEGERTCTQPERSRVSLNEPETGTGSLASAGPASKSQESEAKNQTATEQPADAGTTTSNEANSLQNDSHGIESKVPTTNNVTTVGTETVQITEQPVGAAVSRSSETNYLQKIDTDLGNNATTFVAGGQQNGTSSGSRSFSVGVSTATTPGEKSNMDPWANPRKIAPVKDSSKITHKGKGAESSPAEDNNLPAGSNQGNVENTSTIPAKGDSDSEMPVESDSAPPDQPTKIVDGSKKSPISEVATPQSAKKTDAMAHDKANVSQPIPTPPEIKWEFRKDQYVKLTKGPIAKGLYSAMVVVNQTGNKIELKARRAIAPKAPWQKHTVLKTDLFQPQPALDANGEPVKYKEDWARNDQVSVWDGKKRCLDGKVQEPLSGNMVRVLVSHDYFPVIPEGRRSPGHRNFAGPVDVPIACLTERS